MNGVVFGLSVREASGATAACGRACSEEPATMCCKVASKERVSVAVKGPLLDTRIIFEVDAIGQ